MNAGLRDERRPDLLLGKPDFFLGCVVTNHKRHEREVMPQYFKLRKKVAAGARLVINQIGYDTRKDDELTGAVARRPSRRGRFRGGGDGRVAHGIIGDFVDNIGADLVDSIIRKV